MSDTTESGRDYYLDLIGTILLGVFTALAAYAAYQAALWGGNQATAYTTAINTLGEANRELLRGVQEQAFDTTVWIEHMKAAEQEQRAAAAEEAAAAAAPVAEGDAEGGGAVPAAAAPAAAEEDDEEPGTAEERAAELAEELAYVEDEPFAKKLGKLAQSRRELVAATKWAKEEHVKRTSKLPPPKRLELARKLVDLADKSEKIEEDYGALLEKLGVGEGDEDEIEAALAQDPAAQERAAQLDKESLATQEAIDKEMDKLAAPMFFESPTYVKSREATFSALLKKGNDTFQDGQKFNAHGDRFTLATVFFTVALFFTGLAPVIRHFSLKVGLLGIGVAIAAGALYYMLNTPFA